MRLIFGKSFTAVAADVVVQRLVLIARGMVGVIDPKANPPHDPPQRVQVIAGLLSFHRQLFADRKVGCNRHVQLG